MSLLFSFGIACFHINFIFYDTLYRFICSYHVQHHWYRDKSERDIENESEKDSMADVVATGCHSMTQHGMLKVDSYHLPQFAQWSQTISGISAPVHAGLFQADSHIVPFISQQPGMVDPCFDVINILPGASESVSIIRIYIYLMS